MSNPAVVILTDPARCQLAEAETLVQALLEVQQLHKAGVPASQAFCDHPAAAMEFLEAYSNAYPVLQLQTSDLPPPQHLYSMAASGRLSPLRPVEAAETAKLEQAGQQHPLYVLSLGAPEALMQALQYNSLAKSSIRVLEIAPIEQARAEPVSVAEAVAAAPLARSSWTERTSAPEWDDEDAPGTEPLTDDPIKLSSVEIDLDRIQIESAGDRQTHDQHDQVHDQPAPALIETAVAGTESSPSSVGWQQTTAEATASSIGIPNPASQPTAPTMPPSEPIADPSPTDLAGTSISQSEVALVGAEPPADDGANTSDEPAPSDMGLSDPPVGEPDEQDLIAGSDGHAPTHGESDVDDGAPTSPSTREENGEDAPAGRSNTFATPGENVFYQPTTSFSGKNDLTYAPPTEDVGEASSFAPLFDLSESAEVIDPEAMYRNLSEPAAEGSAGLKEFDFTLMRAPNSDRADPNDALAACPEGEGLATQSIPEPDEHEAFKNPLTTVHDADV